MAKSQIMYKPIPGASLAVPGDADIRVFARDLQVSPDMAAADLLARSAGRGAVAGRAVQNRCTAELAECLPVAPVDDSAITALPMHRVIF